MELNNTNIYISEVLNNEYGIKFNEKILYKIDDLIIYGDNEYLDPKNLKKYPSIQVVIDLHRDGVNESTKLVTRQNGKRMAQIMFFNGMSRTATNGNIKYLKNPNKQTNLAFSLQLQAQAALKYPGFTRKIYVKGYRYNLHYRGRSLLVEVGAQNNTLSEAKASMSLLAELLNNVLY